MAKPRTSFICQQCGAASPAYLGKCPGCGAWNSMVETIEERRAAPKERARRNAEKPQPLSSLGASGVARIPVPISELDRVLGGGLVPGTLALIGGDPGIGKSTLVLQAAAGLGTAAAPVLYVSAEESAHQIRLRAERLGVQDAHVHILSATDLDAVLATATEEEPALLIVDSIQTVTVDEIASSAGSVSQVRECTARLMQWGKSRNVPVFIIGHVTKEGTIAGPRVLEHMVDAVLYLEGPITLGARLALRSSLDPKRTFRPKVTTLEPCRLMVWSDGFSPMFSGVRSFALTPRDGGRTEIVMTEVLSGAMLPLIRVNDDAAVRRAIATGAPGAATVIDIKRESDALYRGYRVRAALFSALGAGFIVVLLGWHLRSLRRVFDVLAPLAGAVVLVMLAMHIAGVKLTLFHLVALLLVIGIGSNYSLFFERRNLQSIGDPRCTTAAVLLCNVSTAIGFGVLAWSSSPVLSAIGVTAAIGAVCSFLLAALLTSVPTTSSSNRSH